MLHMESNPPYKTVDRTHTYYVPHCFSTVAPTIMPAHHTPAPAAQSRISVGDELATDSRPGLGATQASLMPFRDPKSKAADDVGDEQMASIFDDSYDDAEAPQAKWYHAAFHIVCYRCIDAPWPCQSESTQLRLLS